MEKNLSEHMLTLDECRDAQGGAAGKPKRYAVKRGAQTDRRCSRRFLTLAAFARPEVFRITMPTRKLIGSE